MNIIKPRIYQPIILLIKRILNPFTAFVTINRNRPTGEVKSK